MSLPTKTDTLTPPDPSRLFGLTEGVYTVDVVAAAACSLDLFNWLSKHPAGLSDVCASLELTERPTRVVFTLLAAMDLVEEVEQGVFRLTELSERYLLRSSPWDLTPLFRVHKDRPSGQELLTVLRTGQPLAAQFGGPPGGEPPREEGDWAAGMGAAGFAAEFLAMTDSRNAYLADILSEKLDLTDGKHVLDVAGGSGIYSCALAKKNPTLRATVLEQPPVDEVARQSIANRGVTDRVDVRVGDMLRGPLPTDADVHLLSNVVHDWGEDEVRALLRRSFEALPPGGKIVVHDALQHESNALQVAEYSVLLTVYTAGRCYAAAEIEEFLEQAGFVGAVRFLTAAHRSVIMAGKPV
jgi:SAM-dependent methyltransferase